MRFKFYGLKGIIDKYKPELVQKLSKILKDYPIEEIGIYLKAKAYERGG